METFGRKYPRQEVNTNRGVEILDSMDERDNYWHNLGFENSQEFLAWIQGKTVVDIGSGYGFMGLDVKRSKGDNFSTIFNVNPSLRDSDFREMLRERIAMRYHLNPEIAGDNTEIEALYEFAKKHSVASEWDSLYTKEKDRNFRGEVWSRLPFADGSVDRIICSSSFPMYVEYAPGPTQKKKYKDVLEEKKRVLHSMVSMLKPGGEIRLYPVRKKKNTFTSTDIVIDDDCLQEFDSVEVEWKELADKTDTFCLCIRKPLQAESGMLMDEVA